MNDITNWDLCLHCKFIKELVNSTCQQRYGRSLEPWELSLIWSFIVSIYCMGGLAGTLYAGHLAGVYGRYWKCIHIADVLVRSYADAEESNRDSSPQKWKILSVCFFGYYPCCFEFHWLEVIWLKKMKSRRKKVIHVWNYMRMSKWWENSFLGELSL